MHPSTHNPGRDAGSGWSEPKAKRPAKKRKKKSAAKKKTAKKTAKKSAAKSARPTVTALRHEVTALKREVAELSGKLAELMTVVERTTHSALDPFAGEDLGEDPFLRWLQDPSIEQYRGRHVAIHATRGVVADADSLRDLIAAVRAQGIARDEVCLATVPSGPF